MKIGIKQIEDEYDPSLGLLFSRDIDVHFNWFELSFYAPVHHNFQYDFDQ